MQTQPPSPASPVRLATYQAKTIPDWTPNQIIIDAEPFFIKAPSPSRNLGAFLKAYHDALTHALHYYIHTNLLSFGEERVPQIGALVDAFRRTIKNGEIASVHELIRSAASADDGNTAESCEPDTTEFEQEQIQGFYDAEMSEQAKLVLEFIQRAIHTFQPNNVSLQVKWYLSDTSFDSKFTKQLQSAFACATSDTHIVGSILTPDRLNGTMERAIIITDTESDVLNRCMQEGTKHIIRISHSRPNGSAGNVNDQAFHELRAMLNLRP